MVPLLLVPLQPAQACLLALLVVLLQPAQARPFVLLVLPLQPQEAYLQWARVSLRHPPLLRRVQGLNLHRMCLEGLKVDRPEDQRVDLMEGLKVDRSGDLMEGHSGARGWTRRWTRRGPGWGSQFFGCLLGRLLGLFGVGVAIIGWPLKRSYVAEGVAQHVVKLGLFFLFACFFCRSFRFGHRGTQFTHMARLK